MLTAEKITTRSHGGVFSFSRELQLLSLYDTNQGKEFGTRLTPAAVVALIFIFVLRTFFSFSGFSYREVNPHFKRVAEETECV
jgi:hypothetical protein